MQKEFIEAFEKETFSEAWNALTDAHKKLMSPLRQQKKVIDDEYAMCKAVMRGLSAPGDSYEYEQAKRMARVITGR